MLRAIALALAAGLITQTPVAAHEKPRPLVVVELFSSQGCAACLPSKALVGELDGAPQVLALTYPVAHWDYLGWKDDWAKPEFAARQKAYARAVGLRSIATPQIMVNGGVAFVGDETQDVRRYVAGSSAPNTARLTLARRGDEVEAVVEAGPRLAPAHEVWLVRYDPQPRAAKVKSGENAGRKVVTHNVVTGIELLGRWAGAPARYVAPCGSACAVLIQSSGGEIAAAARLE